MNQNGFLKPKIKTGFDLIRSVSVRLTLCIQLYCKHVNLKNYQIIERLTSQLKHTVHNILIRKYKGLHVIFTAS